MKITQKDTGTLSAGNLIDEGTLVKGGTITVDGKPLEVAGWMGSQSRGTLHIYFKKGSFKTTIGQVLDVQVGEEIPLTE